MILDNAYKILTVRNGVLILSCVARVKAAPISQAKAFQ